MNTTREARRKVLFVDDDQGFLDTMRSVLGVLSQGRWEILTAASAGQALVLLQSEPVQLVVIDVQMPVMDGLQFLGILNRTYPHLQKVVLTGFATEAYRAACLSNGAELFLEKPKTRDEHQNLFATLDEISRFKPEPGFRGVLRHVGIEDVIQLECLARKSSILEIRGENKAGAIYIQDGSVVHAACGERRGQEAFNRLLCLKGGEFQLKPFADPGEQSIQGSWEFLLMEAARLRDEVAEIGGWDTALTTRPAPEPEPPGLLLAPTDQILAEESVAGVTAQASCPAAASVPEGGFESLPETAMPSGLAERRAIDEVVICSSGGEVLCEWQSSNSDFWVNFLEFVSRKSRQIVHGLDAGYFERLELEEGNRRLIALLLPDRAILIRAHGESPGSASGLPPD